MEHTGDRDRWDRGELPGDVTPRAMAQVVVALLTGMEIHAVFDPDFEPEPYYRAVSLALTRSLAEGGGGS